MRVASLRTRNDLTHWRRARFNRFGNGGWWNFGGIHREVTIRPARGLDIARAQALPRLACPTCPARVEVRALVRNVGAAPLQPTVTAAPTVRRSGWPRRRSRRARAGSWWVSSSSRSPGCGTPGADNLYPLDVRADSPGGATARYEGSFGVRDLRKLADGRVLLNGRPLFARGVSFHEDDARAGSAWRGPQFRDFLRRIDELGRDRGARPLSDPSRI